MTISVDLTALNEHLAHCVAELGQVQTSPTSVSNHALLDEINTLEALISTVSKTTDKVNEIIIYLEKADTSKLKLGAVPGRLV